MREFLQLYLHALKTVLTYTWPGFLLVVGLAACAPDMPHKASPLPDTAVDCPAGRVLSIERPGAAVDDLSVQTPDGGEVAPMVQVLPTTLLIYCPPEGGTAVVSWF